MRIDKKTKKIIDQMTKMSFTSVGGLNETQVRKNTKLLSGLPRSGAITALGYYLKRLKDEISKSTLEVESPLPLSADQLKKVKDMFASKYRVSEVTTSVNSSLFGGVKVKLGDVVFDDTVRGKISQLKGSIISRY